jgi:hypothetical protein
MILKDLLDDADYDEVFEELKNNYYKDESQEELLEVHANYNEVFNKLMNLELEFGSDNYTLNITTEKEWDFDENGNSYHTDKTYWHVNCINDTTKENYGIDFCRWNEVLGYDVVRDQVKEIGKSSYIAHVLYELTYYGFDENSIADVADGLKEMLNDCKEDLNSVIWNQMTDELEAIDKDIWGDEDED